MHIASGFEMPIVERYVACKRLEVNVLQTCCLTCIPSDILNKVFHLTWKVLFDKVRRVRRA